MKIDILTLFPEMFSPLEFSIIKRARDKGIIDIELHNIRDFTRDKHRKVDDYPYGGGYGMVMMPDPIFQAVENVKTKCSGTPRIIMMSPGGKLFSQDSAREFSKENNLIFICGHYEGIDDRVRQIVDDEISIGDYVLTGGEIASMVVIDCLLRMVPGVLSSNESYEDESFYNGLLEYPQYTRPEVYKDMKVPEILLSGDHEKVREWRKYQSLKKTLEKRPDLLKDRIGSEDEMKILRKIQSEDNCI